MKKVWKAGIAGLAALSIGAAGFFGTSAAFAVEGEGSSQEQPAVTGPQITIDHAVAGHTYEAYQVFAGDLYNGILSNIVWGSGVNVTSTTATLDLTLPQGMTAPATKTAKGWAEWLTEHNSDASYTKAFATAINSHLKTQPTASTSTFNETNKSYTISLDNVGYYLVKDQDTSLNNQTDQAYTSLILRVLGDVTMSPKSKVPTVSKEVEDDTTTGGTDFGSSADHTLFDTFQFKLVASIPANADRADYDSYMIRFKDTMSNGITFEQVNSVVVSGTTAGDSATAAQITVPTSGYTLKGKDGELLTAAQDGGEFSIEIADLKALRTADDKALDITKDITATVLYNAHLNASAVITDQTHNPDTNGASSNPNTVYLEYSNNPNATGEGKTTPQKVYVYSFDMDGNKVDKNDNTKKLAGAEFELYKDADMTKQIKIAEVSTSGTGNVYRAAAANVANAKIVTPANGKFTIQGLDNGTYYLKETKAPNGYNLPTTPFAFTVEATHTVDAGVPSVTLTDGKVNLTIENTSGSQLPTTGGMGTTVLYVAGAAIVLIAGIGLAVTLRRRQA